MPPRLQRNRKTFEAKDGLFPYDHNPDLAACLFSGGAGGTLASTGTPLTKGVSKALAAVVSRSSLRQSAKGLLTAGILKSASYSLAKVTQAIAGRKKRQDMRRG